MSSQYWIVAIGSGDEDPSSKASAAKNALQKDATSVFSLDVPVDLTYKSFDSLIKLVDELVKLDSQVEATLRRVEKQMIEFGNPEFCVINTSGRTKCTWSDYIANFKWDDTKYPKATNILDTAAAIHAGVQKCDISVRASTSTFSELKSAHATASMSKKDATLVNRELMDVITPQTVKTGEFVETEHLTTLVIVIPRGGAKEFEEVYQSWDKHVVPESAKQLEGIPADKDGNTLWRVVMFKSAAANFRLSARGKRFTVRSFAYSAEKHAEQLAKRANLTNDLAQQELQLKTICTAVFSDLFCGWVHVKALRTFVEAVLRFGVTKDGRPKFAALSMLPGNNVKALRDTLATVSSGKPAEKTDDEDDFYPYVFLTMTPLAEGGP